MPSKMDVKVVQAWGDYGYFVNGKLVGVEWGHDDDTEIKIANDKFWWAIADALGLELSGVEFVDVDWLTAIPDYDGDADWDDIEEWLRKEHYA